MREQDLNLTSLAERTKELDPEGHGVSYQLISFLTTSRRSKRDTASPRSAGLIAQALDRKLETLFELSVTDMRRTGDGEPLREAIRQRETGPALLAARTKEIDPQRRGVAERVIARLADPDETDPPAIPQRGATLIAEALGTPEILLFEPSPSVMPACSA
jgi:hypothetical protein